MRRFIFYFALRLFVWVEGFSYFLYPDFYQEIYTQSFFFFLVNRFFPRKSITRWFSSAFSGSLFLGVRAVFRPKWSRDEKAPLWSVLSWSLSSSLPNLSILFFTTFFQPLFSFRFLSFISFSKKKSQREVDYWSSILSLGLAASLLAIASYYVN